MKIIVVVALLAILWPTSEAIAPKYLDEILFCACDNDASNSVSIEEAIKGNCKVTMMYLLNLSFDGTSFMAVDANNDGNLSSEEMKAYIDNLEFGSQAAEANHPEWHNGIPKKDIIAAFERFYSCSCDNDGDGAITVAEMQLKKCVEAQKYAMESSLNKAQLAQADANGDSELDAGELFAAWQNNLWKLEPYF